MFDTDNDQNIIIPQALKHIYNVIGWFDDEPLQNALTDAKISGKVFLGTKDALESFITNKLHEVFGSSAKKLEKEFLQNPDNAVLMLLGFSEVLSAELFPYLQPRFITEDNTNPPCPYPIGMVVNMINVWKNKDKAYV